MLYHARVSIVQSQWKYSIPIEDSGEEKIKNCEEKGNIKKNPLYISMLTKNMFLMFQEIMQDQNVWFVGNFLLNLLNTQFY